MRHRGRQGRPDPARARAVVVALRTPAVKPRYSSRVTVRRHASPVLVRFHRDTREELGDFGGCLVLPVEGSVLGCCADLGDLVTGAGSYSRKVPSEWTRGLVMPRWMPTVGPVFSAGSSTARWTRKTTCPIFGARMWPQRRFRRTIRRSRACGMSMVMRDRSRALKSGASARPSQRFTQARKYVLSTARAACAGRTSSQGSSLRPWRIAASAAARFRLPLGSLVHQSWTKLPQVRAACPRSSAANAWAGVR